MNDDELLKIIEDDDLGLLDIKPRNVTVTADERLVASFEEINAFVRENGREPVAGGGIREHQLSMRLKSLREDDEKARALVGIDEFGLLKNVVVKKIDSVEDIIHDDDLGLFEDVDDGLFDLKHVPLSKPEKSSPDFVARRQSLRDFESYEPMFKKCQSELSLGQRKLIPFVESEMQEGDFFVLNGMLVFLRKIYEPYRGNSNKINRRTHCIFENGTESNVLLRSLGKALSENGYSVSRSLDELQKNSIFGSDSDGVAHEVDKRTGFIYIVKSLSSDDRIRSIKNLYKIGFSNIAVEERVKNASADPTYLMAPVAIMSTFECFNFDPQKLEQLLHNFFGAACLNLDVFDSRGQRHMPREWFVAPLPVIEKAVELIINGGIVNYRYDEKQQVVVLK